MDGRDVRIDVGGVKISPTTTPKKLVDSTKEEISDLVVELVENVSDLKDRDDGEEINNEVKNILNEIVDVSKEAETKGEDDVTEILNEIVDYTRKSAEKKSEDAVTAAKEVTQVLNDIIDNSTQGSEKTLKAVADTLNDILEATSTSKLHN